MFTATAAVRDYHSVLVARLNADSCMIVRFVRLMIHYCQGGNKAWSSAKQHR